jgi:hypothetical protein
MQAEVKCPVFPSLYAAIFVKVVSLAAVTTQPSGILREKRLGGRGLSGCLTLHITVEKQNERIDGLLTVTLFNPDYPRD